MTTLFVNACMRGEASRTLARCAANTWSASTTPWRLTLRRSISSRSTPIVWRTVRRSRGQGSGTIPFFSLSRQFAEADDIVIGVPYWDLSFPAAFKTYLEHVSVCELTFHYTEDGALRGHLQSEAHHVHHHVRRLRRGCKLRLRVHRWHRQDVRHSLKSASWRPRGWTSWASTPRSRWTRLVPRWRNSIERVRQNLQGGPTVSRRSRFRIPRGSMTACPSSRYPLWCSALSTAWILDLSTTGCGWPRCSMPCWKRRA